MIEHSAEMRWKLEMWAFERGITSIEPSLLAAAFRDFVAWSNNSEVNFGERHPPQGIVDIKRKW